MIKKWFLIACLMLVGSTNVVRSELVPPDECGCHITLAQELCDAENELSDDMAKAEQIGDDLRAEAEARYASCGAPYTPAECAANYQFDLDTAADMQDAYEDSARTAYDNAVAMAWMNYQHCLFMCSLEPSGEE